MKVTGDDLQRAWRQDGPEDDTDRSGCLSEMAWARLLAREVSEEERVRAAEHIGSCSRCADELQLLSGLQSWEARLATVLPPDGDARSRVATPASWLAPRRLAWLAAAAALLTVIALPLMLLLEVRRDRSLLSAQLSQQQQALDSSRASLAALERQLEARRSIAPDTPLSAPRLDIPVLDLEPQEAGTVRGGVAAIVTRVDQAAPIATLILHFPPLARRSTLEGRLIDGTGQQRWVGRSEQGRLAASVTVALPIALYPPGRYEFRLFDVTRARRPIGTYRLEIGSASRKDP